MGFSEGLGFRTQGLGGFGLGVWASRIKFRRSRIECLRHVKYFMLGGWVGSSSGKKKEGTSSEVLKRVPLGYQDKWPYNPNCT